MHTQPFFTNSHITLFHADSLQLLKEMADNSLDACVTDPPYELGFMGKTWDNTGIAYNVALWREVLRVLKPGGHLLSFGGSRTYHRMAVAIEDAGFEIRDQIMWVYGSGFPKSLDVSKAIDKAAGVEREKILVPTKKGNLPEQAGEIALGATGMTDISKPITEAAKEWSGFGTALKPAHEPICVARKPFDTTVAQNVQHHRTGAINIDGCRVSGPAPHHNYGRTSGEKSFVGESDTPSITPSAGRWPANFIHDGSEEVLELFPVTGPSKSSNRGLQNSGRHGGYGDSGDNIKLGTDTVRGHSDSGGSAARFFKCCPPDDSCSLCCLPLCEASETVETWLNLLAIHAEKSGWTTRAMSEVSALSSVTVRENENLVHNVKSAGNLCNGCAMSIAVALVGIKTSAFNRAELQVILDSIGNCGSYFLFPKLASFAELWASIATIPTIGSLSILFGSVRDAIANSTSQENVGKVVEGSGQEQATSFRYVAKAAKSERGEGNTHPTVKPLALMRYLCRLVTPPGGTVLDPFGGSGTTALAAQQENFRALLIERELPHCEIIRKRFQDYQVVRFSESAI